MKIPGGERPLKIAIDARMIRYTGIGRYIQNLVERLAATDRKNSYGILVNGADAGEAPRGDNIRVLTARVDIPVYSLREQALLPIEMNAGRPDLLHYPSFNMPLLNGRPYVVTIHDLIYLDRDSCPSMSAHMYARFMFKRAVKTARRIITVSEYTKSGIVRRLGVAPDKITVIHNGVSASYRPPSARTRERVLSRYGIKDEFIFYAGNHQPRKNLMRLVDAFAGMKDTNLRLVLAGKVDPRRAELYNAVRNKGLNDRVLFIGEVPEDDLPALYSGAVAFAFPSLAEGFGFPPLEAMACGAPVVSSNVTSLPEVVGDAGVMVDPLDTGSIKEGLEKVIGSPTLRSELREKGLERVKKFTWEAAAEKTLRVYEEALN